MTSFFTRNPTCLTTGSPFTALGLLRDMKLFEITPKALAATRPPVLLPALWQARHSPFSSFVDTSTRAVASTFKNYKLNPQLLISKETRMHSFAQVHHRHLHGSATAPSRRSCSNSRRRCRCRPAAEMKPRHQRDFKKRQFEQKNCLARCPQGTPRLRLPSSSLRNLMVAIHAVHLKDKVTLPVDW